MESVQELSRAGFQCSSFEAACSFSSTDSNSGGNLFVPSSYGFLSLVCACAFSKFRSSRNCKPLRRYRPSKGSVTSLETLLSTSRGTLVKELICSPKRMTGAIYPGDRFQSKPNLRQAKQVSKLNAATIWWKEASCIIQRSPTQYGHALSRFEQIIEWYSYYTIGFQESRLTRESSSCRRGDLIYLTALQEYQSSRKGAPTFPRYHHKSTSMSVACTHSLP